MGGADFHTNGRFLMVLASKKCGLINNIDRGPRHCAPWHAMCTEMEVANSNERLLSQMTFTCAREETQDAI
jgi:hypothetical protein